MKEGFHPALKAQPLFPWLRAVPLRNCSLKQRLIFMLYPQAQLHSPGSLFKQIATGMKLVGHMRKINLGGWPHDKAMQQLNVSHNQGAGQTGEERQEIRLKQP